MKFRKWESSGAKGTFRYKRKELDLSCSAYNPIELSGKDDEIEWEESSGIFDKNGKEVFQGDIVNSHLGVGLIMKTDAGFEVQTGGRREELWFVTMGQNAKLFEVIGNIHENRELLT